MATPEPYLDDLAAAVLDGTPVNWPSVESSFDVESHALLKELEVVAALASFHREAATVPVPPAWMSAMLSAEVPERWGHLRLLERVGRGSFGEVYRAWDTRLDREVALKLLSAGRSRRPHGASTIIEEGRLLARVRHPNVVTIYGAEELDGRIGLWMEFVQGRTLEQLLQRGRVFTAHELIEIGIELCHAVSAVHAAGLLHRDIKAHNVIRADDGRIVLMDFGAGVALEDGPTSDPAGTPLYIAPEVFRGNSPTIQSDVYSFGVLLYHLATRSYPVQGRTIQEVRRAHEGNERVPIQTARADLHDALLNVIERAVDPEPERRHRNVDALAAALAAATPRPRAPSWLWAAAAALVLVVAALSWTVLRRADSSASPASQAQVDVPTIAVLPFENRSSEPDSEDFVNGLTDEIVRELASIEGLQTRASSSAFAVNRQLGLASIGAELGVKFVLEGSVSRSGHRIRVNARLVRIADESTLWANKFERTLDDLITIQDDISLGIINQLRLKLGVGQRRYELAPELYYLFLRGRGLQIRRTPDSYAAAADLFADVVRRDPGYAPAWAGLANAAAQRSLRGAAGNLPTIDNRMRDATLRALELDPLLAEAHAAMGSLYAFDRNWSNAETSFSRALELNPSLTNTHADYAVSTLMPLGRFQEAVRLLERGRAVDPLSLDIRRMLALAQVDAGQYDDAIANCRWVLARDPKFPYARQWLGRALVLSGRTNEAYELYGPKAGGPYAGYFYAVTGRRAEAEAVIGRMDHPPSQMLVYAGLGDKDRAFEALERSDPTDWYRVAMYIQRREAAILRGDPRFTALKAKLGLPD